MDGIVDSDGKYQSEIVADGVDTEALDQEPIESTQGSF